MLQVILARYRIKAEATLENSKAQTALSAVDTPSSAGSSGLSKGDIAGIVIGSVVGAILVAAAAYFIARLVQRRRASHAGIDFLLHAADTCICAEVKPGFFRHAEMHSDLQNVGAAAVEQYYARLHLMS